MVLRRLLLLGGVLLFVAAAASALAPRGGLDGPSPAVAPADTGTPPSVTVARGALPADQVIEATVGDVVELTVTADRPDEVEIPSLELRSAVDSGLPAKMRFVVDRAGRFRVRLRFSGDSVGVVEVSGAE